MLGLRQARKIIGGSEIEPGVKTLKNVGNPCRLVYNIMSFRENGGFYYDQS